MTREGSRPVSACAVAGSASRLVGPVMIAVPGGLPVKSLEVV